MRKIIIPGQVRGGKNNMGVTRTGRHYPRDKKWVAWRDRAVLEIMSQMMGFRSGPPPLTPRYWIFCYTPGDKRTRDIPAIMDSVFHCLERAGAVVNDTEIKDAMFMTFEADKENPRIKIMLCDCLADFTTELSKILCGRASSKKDWT